jgi:NTE family protein
VATNILNGTEVTFTNGKLYDAIRASISIPTVFQPKNIDDQYYVDGGLLNPIPVNRVKRHEGDLLIAVDVCSPIPYEKRTYEDEQLHARKQIKQINQIREKTSNLISTKKNDPISIFNLTTKSIVTMMQKISQLTLEKHHIDLLINISIESFNMYDFYKAKEIIKEGEMAAREALQKNATFQ